MAMWLPTQLPRACCRQGVSLPPPPESGVGWWVGAEGPERSRKELDIKNSACDSLHFAAVPFAQNLGDSLGHLTGRGTTFVTLLLPVRPSCCASAFWLSPAFVFVLFCEIKRRVLPN